MPEDELDAPPPSVRSRSTRGDEARRLARAAEANEADDDGSSLWRWGLIGGGVAVALTGVAIDLLSPTSANYELDAVDAVAPIALGVGALAVIGGIFLGASTAENDDED